MVEKIVAGYSCQLDKKFPTKPEDIKPIISSTFVNMNAYPDVLFDPALSGPSG
jgi:hypothetical protein